MRKFFSILFMFTFSVLFSANAETPEKAIKPFTGKVLGYKVRLRTKPDLESHIISKLNKNDLLLVVGQEENFWKVAPLPQTKAYVFRSYILDNKIEANRVNVRLSPNTSAPIVGQLCKGDVIEGVISQQDRKWLEISPPKDTVFYIAKEFVGYAGTKSYFATMHRKKSEVKQLLNDAYLMVEKECKKPFDQMHSNKAIALFEKVIEEYAEFEEFATQAKEGLALLKDNYLQKKVAFLEKKATIVNNFKVEETPKPFIKKDPPSVKMDSWQSVEKSLFQKWTTFHPNKSLDDFYAEQKLGAIQLTGIVRSFDHNIKNKPGNYVLEGSDSPVGYLYSTMVDLEKYAGKKITVNVSPRSNHHFAFPAYFVIETIE